MYGWGWFRQGDDRSVEVPPPFAIDAQITNDKGAFRAGGKVNLADHMLNGLWVRLSQRHTEWDGDCNLAAYSKSDSPDGEWIYAGYGQVTWELPNSPGKAES